MKLSPILFKPDMVRAILAGRKTQTRRLVKPQPGDDVTDIVLNPLTHQLEPPIKDITYFDADLNEIARIKPSYGTRGDLLWVRETFGIRKDKYRRICFRAGDEAGNVHPVERWKPAIYLKKRDARLWLQVTNLRVEHLGDMTEADAKAEGFADLNSFDKLWARIHGPKGCEANILVYVYDFKILSTSGFSNVSWRIKQEAQEPHKMLEKH